MEVGHRFCLVRPFDRSFSEIGQQRLYNRWDNDQTSMRQRLDNQWDNDYSKMSQRLDNQWDTIRQQWDNSVTTMRQWVDNSETTMSQQWDNNVTTMRQWSDNIETTMRQRLDNNETTVVCVSVQHEANCTFEDGLCSFVQDFSRSITWKRNIEDGKPVDALYLPPFDHTTMTGWRYTKLYEVMQCKI